MRISTLEVDRHLNIIIIKLISLERMESRIILTFIKKAKNGWKMLSTTTAFAPVLDAKIY